MQDVSVSPMVTDHQHSISRCFTYVAKCCWFGGTLRYGQEPESRPKPVLKLGLGAGAARDGVFAPVLSIFHSFAPW
jgi:hypothetical protein